jgi:hypothetical protein
VIALAAVDRGIIVESASKTEGFFTLGMEGIELTCFQILERLGLGEITDIQEGFTGRSISASLISGLILGIMFFLVCSRWALQC